VGRGGQRVQDSADLRVEVLDHAVVLGELIADHVLRPRPGREVLVARQ
jgi:hypothetical protein